MNAISETFRILWLIFLWFGFSFMILVSLLSFIFGDWQWGALFLIMCPVFLAVIDMAHSESIVDVYKRQHRGRLLRQHRRRPGLRGG